NDRVSNGFLAPRLADPHLYRVGQTAVVFMNNPGKGTGINIWYPLRLRTTHHRKSVGAGNNKSKGKSQATSHGRSGFD
ncbi:MAG: hypothetical protein ACRD3T_04755, partial [Terriglobia bacterium]